MKLGVGGYRYTGDVILRGKADVRVIAVELSVQVWHQWMDRQTMGFGPEAQ